MLDGRTRFILVVAAMLAGCSSAPQTRYHTLMPTDVAAAAAAAAPIAVVLEPVRVPAQVDQPQWLVRLADGGVAVLEQDRWASPLRDELRQALREDLIVRYGASETRPASGVAPIRVGVDVRRFDSVLSREARTEGTWTLAGGDTTGARVFRCDWFIREVAGTDTQSLAAAHRRAVARLGNAIGEGLQKMSRNEAASCPARDVPG